MSRRAAFSRCIPTDALRCLPDSAARTASLLADRAFLQFRQYLVEREAAGLLPRRKLDVGLQVLGDEGLRWDEQERSFDTPFVVVAGVELSLLEGIGAQVEDFRQSQRDQWILPDVEAFGPLLHEQELP